MKKGLSLSTPTLKFNFESVGRDSFYYGQFRYMARFYLDKASTLRSSSHRDLDRTLDLLSARRWNAPVVTDDIRENLHTVYDQLENLKNPHKKIIFAKWVYFYTNELQDIDSLSQGPMEMKGSVCEALITHQYGTIGQLNPKYKYRTYFSNHRPTVEQINTFRQFIENCGDEVKISPGFRDWLANQRIQWILDHYFIDHNDSKIITMIALINPQLIRKTKPIVKINN